MSTVSVNVTFEATSLKKAEEAIAAWKLHDGCTVSGAVMNQLPQRRFEKGKLEEILPPAPPQPPPTDGPPVVEE